MCTVEGWNQSNFLECGQTACGKVATTGSQQGHSNPSKHKGIAFIWRIQSTIITNTREPTPRTADYSSASTALHYKQSFCHNGLIWEGVRLSERRKQWKEKNGLKAKNQKQRIKSKESLRLWPLTVYRWTRVYRWTNWYEKGSKGTFRWHRMAGKWNYSNMN